MEQTFTSWRSQRYSLIIYHANWQPHTDIQWKVQ